MAGSSVHALSAEIITDILARLSVYDLGRVLCVASAFQKGLVEAALRLVDAPSYRYVS